MIAAIDWIFLRQRVHHLAIGLANMGIKVLFVENTAIRSPRISDVPRIFKRLNTVAFRADEKCEETIPKNIKVYSPMVIPLPYNRAATELNYSILKKRILKFLDQENLQPDEVLLYTYLATPLILKLVDDFTWQQVIYDVVSDPKLVEPKINTFEKKLLFRADITLFASSTLLDEYKKETKNPILFRDGFSTELMYADVKMPLDITQLPHPRFLYIGGINRKLWVEGIIALCKVLTHGSIILMGPVADGEILLPKLPNLYILPPAKRYIDLAGALRAVDVGLIPYKLDAYTNAMHPAKINEYIVSGLPVVSTATPELIRLAKEFPFEFIYFGTTPQELAEAGLRAYKSKADLSREKINTFISQHSWANRVLEFLKLCNFNTS